MFSLRKFECLYRRIGRRSDYKKFHVICVDFPSFSNKISYNGVRFDGKKLYRYFSTSMCFKEKSEPKDNKDGNGYSITLKKENEEIIKKVNTDIPSDILVKAETDKDKVVTKVTIEKVKNDLKPPPGKYINNPII